jgi:hypothetical protein
MLNDVWERMCSMMCNMVVDGVFYLLFVFVGCFNVILFFIGVDLGGWVVIVCIVWLYVFV